MLVDSHCHLDFPAFDTDRQQVLERAEQSGVRYLLTVATTICGHPKLQGIINSYRNVFGSVGVHPHHLEAEMAALSGQRSLSKTLVNLAGHPKVVAIGESGLDYFRCPSSPELQQASFRSHIRACLESGLPLIIHHRQAEADLIRLLREESAGVALSGVLHCFAGSRWLAEQALELGLSISFAGILTFKKAQALTDVATSVPIDRLLVETDSPYLAPVPHRGLRNEPSLICHTAKALARCRQLALPELERYTSENFLRLFAGAALDPDGFGSAECSSDDSAAF